MTAVIAAGQRKQEQREALGRWAEEIGISIDDLADEILQSAENAIRRRLARNAAEAAGGNVVPFLPAS